ncbi:MAG: hypothetical protein EP330_28360 [Deltaproteobacteria bacterium]|nr:MAG: hypothetical protein EP330_28360 [Deltaproteobacteria bacterium]
MPEVLADVTVLASDQTTEEVTLTLHKAYKHKALGAPGDQLDPVSTLLEPKPVSGDGTVYWLVGHGLSTHEEPGDTQITYSLLLEVHDGSEAVQALWWENRMEVPTSLYAGKGTVVGKGPGGALTLDVSHTEYGDALHITGAVRGL